MEEDKDFKQDELIEIKLPRAEYEILKDMIQREQAFNWFKNAIRTNLIWVVGGGIVTFLLMYEKFNALIHGVK